MAAEGDMETLFSKFSGLYGPPVKASGCATFETANGTLRIFTRPQFEKEVGPLPVVVQDEAQPFIAGMDFSVEDLSLLAEILDQAGVPFRKIYDGLVTVDPKITANTIFRFFSLKSEP